jgi:hypothetical protein
MKVSDLQAFLFSLSQALAASGSKQVAVDLDRARAGLEPFKDMGVAIFADFLAQAEAYHRDGVLPAQRGSRKKTGAGADEGKVKAAAQHVQELYEHAIDADLSYAAIEAAIKKMDKELSKDEAIALAMEVGLTEKPKSKKAALEEIRRKIVTRKESFERSQFRAETPTEPAAALS